MIQRFIYTGIILFSGLIFASPVLAATDQISVTATVAPTRVIYLDSIGDVQKVVGNTAANITPSVTRDNRAVALNSHVVSQYEALLKENGGTLTAGQTYFSDKYYPYRQLANWILSNPTFNSRLI